MLSRVPNPEPVGNQVTLGDFYITSAIILAASSLLISI